MNICYLALSIGTRRIARNLQCVGCYGGLVPWDNWGFGASPPSARAWSSGGKAPATGGTGPGERAPSAQRNFFAKIA